jgi:hypothetical protein
VPIMQSRNFFDSKYRRGTVFWSLEQIIQVLIS